jgi:hypothetical protein
LPRPTIDHPDPADKAANAGIEQLRAEQRAFRLAEMRRLSITQAQVAARMGITQGPRIRH